MLGDLDIRNQAVAAWALGALAHRVGDQTDWEALCKAARRHPDRFVRIEAMSALGKRLRTAPDRKLLETLVAGTDDGESRVRYVAMQAMRLAAEDRVTIPPAVWDVDDEDFGVQFEAGLLRTALNDHGATFVPHSFAG